MKNRDGLVNNDNWETPDWLYKQLDNEFHFDFDPCPLNADFDGLSLEWGKSNFVNPPYNRKDKPKFIQKAYEQWKKGKTCVLLIPAATGTKQFHELILPNAEIRFLKGRVAFKGYNTKGEYTTKNKGKHDSMIVIFHSNKSIK
ncbi:MAG: phage N-6-adenine-methyltransferase [Candidatus Omnitrophica bacterium]|jgi:phage N-6-adenine-methyltransferase|nr:phage N-6-adenine-methyltransferase [Candidatus Omnitrophota bacterium]